MPYQVNQTEVNSIAAALKVYYDAAWQDAEGWFFWSYKLLVDGPAHDGWDMGKSIELGYLPAITPLP